MMRILFICLLFIRPCIAFEESENLTPPPFFKETGNLSYWKALVLGTVQGVTEFLPISSTGHLIIANRALKLDANSDPLLDLQPEYTMKDAADSYAIVIQGGTILAIVFLYWKQVLSILLGLVGQDRRGRRLARNIILAFLPAAVLGLLLGDWIADHLFSPKTVMIALLGGAVLMFGVEKWRKAKIEDREIGERDLDLNDLTVWQALGIGGLQCIAMWPGVSRSMITIVGGYIAGLSPVKAAEFSFLLGLVTLSAASCYKLLFDGADMLKVLNLGPAIFGCGVAFFTGAIVVKWLVNYLTKHGLSLFAWYRIALALGIFLASYII